MKPFKEKPDAGWNDPPLFSYNETIEHTRSPKRTMLNKRVPFPMNSVPSDSCNHIDPTAPPTNNPNLPPPPPIAKILSTSISKPPSSVLDLPTSTPEEKDLPSFLSDVNCMLDEKVELLKTQNKDEHIKKKMQVLSDLWSGDKLSGDIKDRLFTLLEALKNKDKEKSNQVQISLMVDYPEICGEFISAFRQLINTIE